ncbi:MAG: hypothetical protein Q8O78_06285 [Candidatus Deferrimicrobium sp.]|nr:hypothetical protein [Candidatus Deferrimicrobium sp.]
MQCMHCFRTKIGSLGFFSFGNRFTTVKAPGVVSRVSSNTLSLEKETIGLGSLFASLQASSQARQPMHFVVSMSMPLNSTPPAEVCGVCAAWADLAPPASRTPPAAPATFKKFRLLMVISLPSRGVRRQRKYFRIMICRISPSIVSMIPSA